MKRHLIASVMFCGLVGSESIAQEDKSEQQIKADSTQTTPKKNPLDPLMPIATYGDGRFRLGGWIDSLDFSPDGKLLASSSDRNGTALWNAETGELVRQFPPVDGNSVDSTATFSPDGKLLVIAAGHLEGRDVATGELRYEIKNAGRRVWENRLVQFTRDGKHFLAYGNAGVLFIEAKTGRIVHTFEIDSQWDRLNGVALTPDGSRAILGTYRLLEPIAEGRSTRATYAVKTWDLSSGKETLPRPPQDEFGSTLKYIQFSPDGKSLVAVTARYSFQQKLKLLDPQSMKLQRVLPTTTGIVRSHAYTPDGKLLAVGTDTTSRYVIHLFDPATGKLYRKWNAERSGNGWGIKLAFSPDGRTIASAIERKPEITLWNTATGTEKFPREEGSSTTIERIAILADNRTLVTQDVNGRVIRRNLRTGRVTGEQVWLIPDSWMGVSTAATELWTSDLRRMGQDPRLKGSDLMADVEKHKHLLTEARISLDGKRVAILFRSTRINIYDRNTGKRLKHFGDPPSLKGPPSNWYLSLSPDGSHVAGFYGGGERHFRNVATGETVEGVPFGRFAPDGSLVTYGGGSVLLWDVNQGKRIVTLSDAPHRMGRAAFSPDGDLMAAVRYPGNTDIAIWDLKTRKVIRVVRGIRGGAVALCFSPDGQMLVACDRSTRTVVWDLWDE